MRILKKSQEILVTPPLVAVFVFWNALAVYRSRWQQFNEVSEPELVDDCCHKLSESENVIGMCLRLLKSAACD